MPEGMPERESTLERESHPDADAFRPHAEGVFYLTFISRLTQRLGARSYFEIGTRKGRSLAAVNCDSVAVDPRFMLDRDVVGDKRMCTLFQMTSDEFFANHQLRDSFPDGVDVAFLDGMHYFDFVLRDFIHTERACRRDSVILMHDCLPHCPEIAASGSPRTLRGRDATSRVTDPPHGGYTGDVWKIIPCLKRWRPDLSLHCLDCRPTGLVLATNLDPTSRVLEEHYDEALAEHADLECEPGWFDRLYDSVALESSRDFIKSRLRAARRAAAAGRSS